MTKIVNLTERGAARNDPRCSYESLPPEIRDTVIKLVGFENQREANPPEGEVAEQLTKCIDAMRIEMRRAAAAANLPIERVEHAANWVRTWPAQTIRLSGRAPYVS